MGYFQVRYEPRVVIYERKMFIRLPLIGKNMGWIPRASIFKLQQKKTVLHLQCWSPEDSSEDESDIKEF